MEFFKIVRNELSRFLEQRYMPLSICTLMALTFCFPVQTFANAKVVTQQYSLAKKLAGLYDAFTQIEAENYDTVSTGIQIQTTNDVSGTSQIGYVTEASFTGYKNIDLTNALSFKARFACDSAGGYIEVRIDSTSGTLLGKLTVPTTGGWSTWATDSVAITPATGVHNLFLVYKGYNNYLFNVNWFVFSTVTVTKSINPLIKIEAENYDSAYGVRKELSSDTAGVKVVVSFIQKNDYSVYKNIDLSALRGFYARASADSFGGGTIQVRVDSIGGRILGVCTIVPTGSWQVYTTASCVLNTITGTHDLYLVFSGDSNYLFNLNWVQFSTSAPPPVSALTKIQAEAYDSMSGIQSETCSDTGKGYDLGYIENNDYTVYKNIDFTGARSFYARAASQSLNGKIEIRLDSLNGALAGICSVPTTDSWSNWTTEACSISTTTGTHDLYLVFTGQTGYLFNLNWVQFSATAPLPRSAFKKIQAELYDTMSGIQTETSSDVGAGINIGYIENQDYTVYRNIDITGARGFFARASSASLNGKIEIRLDSLKGQLAGICPVPTTNSWTTWATDSCTIHKAVGAHDLYLVFTGGAGFLFNMNWFQFTRDSLPVFPNDTIESVCYDSSSGIVNTTVPGADTYYIESALDGDYAVYKNISLSSVDPFYFNTKVLDAGRSIEVRLDSLSGQLLGTATIAAGSSWKTDSCSIASVTGIHTIFLVFKGSSTNPLQLKWFNFTGTNLATGASRAFQNQPVSTGIRKIGAMIIISKESSLGGNLSLYNLSGRCVYNKVIEKGQSRLVLDMNKCRLSRGTYVLWMNIENGARHTTTITKF